MRMLTRPAIFKPGSGAALGGRLGAAQPAPPEPPVDEWRAFTVTAGDLGSGRTGFSNGVAGYTDGGSLSIEPNLAHITSLIALDAGTLTMIFEGDATAFFDDAGRSVLAGFVYLSAVSSVEVNILGNTEVTSEVTFPLAVSGTMRIEFPLESDLTPAAIAFTDYQTVYPADITDAPLWLGDAEGHDLILTSDTAETITLLWDTDHWEFESGELSTETGVGTMVGGDTGQFIWPMSWSNYADPPPPIPPGHYRYWGLRVTQGGSQPDNQIMEIVVSTTPGNVEANAITSGSQFGWSPSSPTIVSGSFDNLIDGGTTTSLRFNKASATGKILYADMGSPIAAESVAIHPGSSTYRLASVRAVASNDLVTWTDMAASLTTNLNTYMTAYDKP